MRNLLTETLNVLKTKGKTTQDVKWVGSYDGLYIIPWSAFESIANIGYDNSYGAPEIAVDLVIVGDNWWLTRGEYDGSEWWDFHTIPILPAGQRVSPFNKIKVVSSKSEIAELNSQKDKGWQ